LLVQELRYCSAPPTCQGRRKRPLDGPFPRSELKDEEVTIPTATPE
jgi:hypothetical protein